MIEFVWPQTNGEWLAWFSAVYLLLIGFALLFVPGFVIRWSAQPDNAHLRDNQAIALMRGPLAGVYIGLSVAVLLLHPQPLLYLALGSAFLFSGFARFISIFADNRSSVKEWIVVIIDCALAFSPIAYALGYVR